MSDVDAVVRVSVAAHRNRTGTIPARVASIDGLRGVLAAIVVIAHFANAYDYPALIPLAKSAVMLFFVISGYVLTLAWNGNFASFIVKRWLRLWPAYAACLAAGAYFSGVRTAWTVYFWYPYLGIGDTVPADPVVWSLFVEAWVTPLMPVVIWAGRRDIRALAIISGFLLIRGVSENLYFGLYFVIGSYLSRRPFNLRALNSSSLQWLGKVSYSLYLSHVIVIGVCRNYIPALAPFIALPLCLLTAQVLWLAIERPSLRASNALGKSVDSQMTARGLPAFLAGPAR